MGYSKIVLMVRSTQNWFNGRPALLDSSHRIRVQYLDFIMKGWKLFFKMDYFQFRQRLTQIARSTFVSNNFDAIFYWFDWDIFRHYNKGTWIVPIDDDDWVSPNLVIRIRQILQEAPPDTNLFRWKTHFVNLDGSVIPRYRMRYRSCAYALKMPCLYQYARDHGEMNRGADNRTPYEISDYLAFKVSNLASLSFLFLDHATMEASVRIAQKRIFMKKELFSPEFHSIIDQYNGLLAELYDSCRV